MKFKKLNLHYEKFVNLTKTFNLLILTKSRKINNFAFGSPFQTNTIN